MVRRPPCPHLTFESPSPPRNLNESQGQVPSPQSTDHRLSARNATVRARTRTLTGRAWIRECEPADRECIAARRWAGDGQLTLARALASGSAFFFELCYLQPRQKRTCNTPAPHHRSAARERWRSSTSSSTSTSGIYSSTWALVQSQAAARQGAAGQVSAGLPPLPARTTKNPITVSQGREVSGRFQWDRAAQHSGTSGRKRKSALQSARNGRLTLPWELSGPETRQSKVQRR